MNNKGGRGKIIEGRVEEMNRMRFEEFKTLQEIADHFHISRERVRQIMGNTGEGYKSFRIARMIKQSSDLTNGQLSKELGISVNRVSRYRDGQRHVEEGSREVGRLAEEWASQRLLELGIGNILMRPSHPFDILLDNKKRVDVKTCKAPHNINGHFYYHYHIDKSTRGNYADYFILTVMKDDGKIDADRVYIVPSKDLSKNISTINIPILSGGRTRYSKYLNQFTVLQG